MKTDFISSKERIKFNDNLFAQELENPADNLGVAINNLQCAQFNKCNKQARNIQILRAITLLQKEIH